MQHSKKKIFITAVFLLFVVQIMACNGLEPFGSLSTPVGSLTVKLDSQGKVKFSVSPGFSIPILIGSLDFGVEVTPQDFSNTESILIIEHDGRIDVYDLKGQHFHVAFEEGYYSEVSLDVQENCIKLIVEREVGASSSVGELRIENDASSTSADGCLYAPPIRVAVGEKAEVCTLEHLLLRKEPDADSQVYYRIKAGHIVTILEGPVCDEHKQWNYWKVRLENNMVGWVAEGGDERLEYFLRPID